MQDLFINCWYDPMKSTQFRQCEDRNVRLGFLFHPEDFGIHTNEQYHMEFEFSNIDNMETVFERTFEWDRLNAIKELLKQGFYKESLTLALLLPDICSKVASLSDSSYPTKDDAKYEKWINDNVYQYEIGEHGVHKDKFDCVNGFFCHNLRCKLVHGDEKDIQLIPNNPESSFIQQGYKKVFFRWTDANESILISICNERKEKYAIIGHSVSQFVLTILCAANTLYKNTENKKLFYDGCEIASIKAEHIEINSKERHEDE